MAGEAVRFASWFGIEVSRMVVHLVSEELGIVIH
jgi:hypothetical protein